MKDEYHSPAYHRVIEASRIAEETCARNHLRSGSRYDYMYDKVFNTELRRLTIAARAQALPTKQKTWMNVTNRRERTLPRENSPVLFPHHGQR